MYNSSYSERYCLYHVYIDRYLVLQIYNNSTSYTVFFFIKKKSMQLKFVFPTLWSSISESKKEHYLSIFKNLPQEECKLLQMQRHKNKQFEYPNSFLLLSTAKSLNIFWSSSHFGFSCSHRGTVKQALFAVLQNVQNIYIVGREPESVRHMRCLIKS